MYSTNFVSNQFKDNSDDNLESRLHLELNLLLNQRPKII